MGTRLSEYYSVTGTVISCAELKCNTYPGYRRQMGAVSVHPQTESHFPTPLLPHQYQHYSKTVRCA